MSAGRGLIDHLLMHRVSLTGVLGATVACKNYDVLTSFSLAHCTTADTSISAIGKRAHAMHVMAFYATICVPLASIG